MARSQSPDNLPPEDCPSDDLPPDSLRGESLLLRRNLSLQVAYQAGDSCGSLRSDRPAWVFLHGGLGNRYNWRCQYEFAHQQGWEVLAYDLAGHGQSSAYARYSIGRHCRDLTRLLQRFKIQQPVLCCHSYGVPLGLEWAQRHPVRGLVLIAGGTHDLDPWWEVPMMRLFNWGGRHLYRWDWLQQKTRQMTSRHSLETVDRFFAESPIPTAVEPYDALEIFWGYNFGKRHGHGLIKTPALVVTGGADPTFTQAMGDRLTQRFVQAQHLHLPQGSHVLMAEFPDQVNGAIADFVRSLP
jgi:pimeloyl-ACP methyl ester carboxylesterase